MRGTAGTRCGREAARSSAGLSMLRAKAVTVAAALDERRQRLPGARVALDRDHGADADRLAHAIELEAALGHLLDLRPLLRVLDEHHRGLGVGDDVAALAGQVRLVDRYGESA